MTYEALLSQAKEKIKLKDELGAESVLLEALKEKKEGEEAFFLLGNIYHTQGKFERAILAYKKALNFKPNYTEAALSLSILYNDLGKYEEGKFFFSRVKSQVPSQEKVEDPFLNEKLAKKHEELGDLYLSYHRLLEAETEYQKALRLKPDDPGLVVKLAKLHEKQGATEKSIKELKNLSHQRPDYIPALIKLGLSYYAQGKMIEAVREWEKVLDMDPHHSEALMYLEMAQKATTTSL